MSQYKTLTIVAVIAALAGGTWYFAVPSTLNKADTGASASGAAGKNGDASARPVSVSTVLAQQRDYPVRISANGTVSALNTVDIRHIWPRDKQVGCSRPT